MARLLFPAFPEDFAGKPTPAGTMSGDRSTFVTVIAWLFIVGSAFATLASLMQTFMFQMMFRGEMLRATPRNLPGPADFVLHGIHWFFPAFLVVSLVMLASSVGLLCRKNWARWVFIVMLSLSVVWWVAGVAMRVFLFIPFERLPHGPQFAALENLVSVIQWFMLIVGAAIVGLSVWIVKRLLSGEVRREFTARGDSSATGS